MCVSLWAFVSYRLKVSWHMRTKICIGSASLVKLFSQEFAEKQNIEMKVLKQPQFAPFGICAFSFCKLFQKHLFDFLVQVDALKYQGL